MNPVILLTNDDGVYAEGIRILFESLKMKWDTYLVAPANEQSAASHALTLNRPLRVKQLEDRVLAIDGTPADCVMLSLKGLLDIKPDMVVSGINLGPNLGDDVIYSGTVAGAAEATILGVPALAASFVDPDTCDYQTGSDIVMHIAEAILEKGLPDDVLLNVNIPTTFNGTYEITELGRRSYREVIIEKVDPRGKPYYWIGGQVDSWRGSKSCDFAAVERGSVSVTPLHLDMTARTTIDSFSDWKL